MRQYLFLLLILIAAVTTLAACSVDDDVTIEQDAVEVRPFSVSDEAAATSCQTPLALTTATVPAPCGGGHFAPSSPYLGLSLAGSAQGFSLADTGDIRIDSIYVGAKIHPTDGVITYSFYEDDIFAGAYPGDEENVKEVSEKVKENIREILRNVETLIPVSFREVSETATSAGSIRILRAHFADNKLAAYAYYPGDNGPFSIASDLILNESFHDSDTPNGFGNAPGSPGYATLVHELGHALGLKHPFEGPVKLPEADDHDTLTVMSYHRLGSAPPVGYMLHDVLALRHIYGTPAPSQEGVRKLKFISTYQWAGDRSLRHQRPAKRHLTFSSPIAALDFGSLPYDAAGYYVDLRPGGWLAKADDVVAGEHSYLSRGSLLALHSVVFDVVTSTSDDKIFGNSKANKVSGYHPALATGHDVLHELTADDTIDLSHYDEQAIAVSKLPGQLTLQLRSDSSLTIMNYDDTHPVRILYKAADARDQLTVTLASAVSTKQADGSYRIKVPVLLSMAAPGDLLLDYTFEAAGEQLSELSTVQGRFVVAAGQIRQDLEFSASPAFMQGQQREVTLHVTAASAGVGFTEQSLAIPLEEQDGLVASYHSKALCSRQTSLTLP